MTASTENKPQFETPFFLSEHNNINAAIIHQHQWLLPNSHYKLIWVKEAIGHHFINGVEQPLMAGHIFILAPEHSHKWKKDSRLTGVVCELSEDVLDEYFHNKLKKLTNINETKAHNAPIYVSKNKEVILNKLIKILLIEVKNGGTLAVIRPIFKTFLHLLEFEESKIHSSESQIAPLTELQQLIERFYFKESGVHFYAQQLNMSIKQLNFLVREIHGKTVSNLIHERIIVDAQLSLQSSQCSVKTIAYNLGFEDPSYFSRFFRRYTGLSPNQYRKSTSSP